MRANDRAGRRGGGRSIRGRVLVLVAGGLLATVALTGLSSWWRIRTLEAQAQARREAMVAGLASQLDVQFGHLLAHVYGLGLSVRSDLVSGDPERAVSTEAIRAAYLQDNEFDALIVGGPDGRIHGGVPSPDVSVAPVAVSLAGRCALEDRPVVHFRATEGSDVREVWLAVRVPDWRGGFGGFAAGRLDVPGRRFADAAAPLLQTGLGSIVLADPRGLVIATSRPAPAIQDVADVMGIAEARMATTGWRVVLLEDPAGAGRPLLLEWLVLSVLLAGLALLFAWGAGQSVRRPLEALTATAERIADGDLSQPVPSIPADEVGRLARAFERMRVALRDSLARIAADNVELEQRVDERTRELARVNQELRDREQARLQLLRKVIRAQEDERKRIARELHDDTCQALTALTMRLEVAQAAVSGQPVETAVSETRALARHSLEGVHRLMHDLRPSVLDDLGLVAALRWLADHRLAPDGISVRFEIGDVPERLAPELETALFRAAQEALINVQRHANAERVLVQIGERDGRFCIEIEDDGEGFSAGELAPRPGDARGLGLLGMRERVELFDGSVTIESSPGNGTRVLIEVPMGPSPADHHAEDPGPNR